MKDWEFAGLSFGGWIVLMIWFISGGLITALLASHYSETIRTIGEYADASPAYWKVAVAVLVCVLIWIVLAALLIKVGRKSNAQIALEQKQENDRILRKQLIAIVIISAFITCSFNSKYSILLNSPFWPYIKYIFIFSSSSSIFFD